MADGLDSLNQPSTLVAVNPGGTNEALLRAALPLATLSLVDENGQQFQQIISGAAALTVTDDIEAQFMALRYPRVLCAGVAATAPSAGIPSGRPR